MERIRYTQRICADQEKIEEFLLRARTGVVGMMGDTFPYCVPVNYVWYKGAVYFHGMGSGKKVDILLKNPSVCFTVYEEIGTVKDPVPCHADTAYLSVMMFGQAEKVADFEEGADALQILVEKYMTGFYQSKMSAALIERYKSSHDDNAVSIFKIVPRELTAKENRAEPDTLFRKSTHG